MTMMNSSTSDIRDVGSTAVSNFQINDFLTPPHSIIFDILETHTFQKYSTRWVFSALYLALPDSTWLYLALL